MRLEIKEAADLLLNGQVVAIPTETVWGLAASIRHPEAIEKIFQLKGRPRKNPLIIHLAEQEELKKWVTDFPPDFEKLSTLWPGPLTLVLKVNLEKVPEKVRASLPTAAFRIPLHPKTRELLKLTGPLVIPSANLSGSPSSTQASHVEEDFGTAFPVMEGETSRIGLESTILAYYPDGWKILRYGAVSADALAPLLGYTPQFAAPLSPGQPECPGQMFRHYAPKADLILSNNLTEKADAIIGFSGRNYSLPAFILGPPNSAEAAAHRLYDVLREIDRQGHKTVLVDMNFPHTGLWITLKERLVKASSKQ